MRVVAAKKWSVTKNVFSKKASGFLTHGIQFQSIGIILF